MIVSLTVFTSAPKHFIILVLARLNFAIEESRWGSTGTCLRL